MKKLLVITLSILVGACFIFVKENIASKQFVRGFVADTPTLILKERNTLVLNDMVTDASVAKTMQKALVMDQKLPPNEPIYFVLNTPGGSIQAGLELITFLKGLNRPVHTVTIFAASMGYIMVQTLDNRYITHFGTLMAHKAKGGVEGELPGQIESRLSFYLKKLNELDTIIVKRFKGKLTLEQYQKLYENEYWVDGFEAISYNMVDKVINVRCDTSLNGTYDEKIMFVGFTFNVTWSKCPMITGPIGVDVNKPSEKVDAITWRKVQREIDKLKNRSNYDRWSPQQIKDANK